MANNSLAVGIIIGISIVFAVAVIIPESMSIPPTDAFYRIFVGSDIITAGSYNDAIYITGNASVTAFPANNTLRIVDIVGGGSSTLASIHSIGNVTSTGCAVNEILKANSTGFWDCAADATGSGGEANTASNIGAGLGLFSNKVGVDLRFDSLIAGQGIDITDTTDDLTIATDFLVSSQTCSGTDKVSAINTATGAVTCSTDEQGGGSDRVVLASTVNCTSTGSTYCEIWTIPLTANSRHSFDGDLISQTSSTTVGIQFRGRTTAAGSVGMCSFVSVSSATAMVFDNIAVSTNPGDTGDTAELTANAQPDRIYCSITTNGTPGNLVIEFQSETGGNVAVLDGSNYRIIVDS